MRGVLLEVSESLLAERRRLGVDVFDEMWEGVLHMVPPPSEEHQRVGGELYAALYPVAKQAGLLLRYETGVFDPHAEEDTSYRVPDLVLFAPEHRSDRGVEGNPALVVEIRSPGDETLDKLAFYQQVGAREMVMVDRDAKDVVRWVLVAGRLAEVEPDQGGWQPLESLPVRLRSDNGKLVVEGPAGAVTI
jgi:Uma2 family endonuclease